MNTRYAMSFVSIVITCIGCAASSAEPEHAKGKNAAETSDSLIIYPQVCTYSGPIDADGGCMGSCPPDFKLFYAPTCGR